MTQRGPAAQIPRVCRPVADLDRAEASCCTGLDFRRGPDLPPDPGLPAPLGLPGTTVMRRVLHLGADQAALVRFDPPSPACPAGSRSNDPWLQHLTVVRDMAAAPPDCTAAGRPGRGPL